MEGLPSPANRRSGEDNLTIIRLEFLYKTTILATLVEPLPGTAGWLGPNPV